jgi:protein-disulfide isomerase
MGKIYILIISTILFTGCHIGDIADNTVYDVPSDIDVTYSKGNANASVVITEYTDYECPFCAKFTLNTLPLLQNDYIETGKVLFIMKDYTIPNHKYAQKAAEATYCAGDQREDAFWEMHVKLYENQDNLEIEDLMRYAEEIGLESNSFNNCLDIDKYKNLILRNRQEGIDLDITATSTLIINDEKVAGLQPYEDLVKIIETQIKN